MSVGVVVVTFNRLNKLKHALALYEEQAGCIDYLIVVDNASTDGTKEFLQSWYKCSSEYKKYLITHDINSGGSGGFYSGLELAQTLDSDWIWVGDDDAYPACNAFLKINQHIEKGDTEGLSAFCAVVKNSQGIDLGSRRRISKKLFRLKDECVSAVEYKAEKFHLNLFSYVGAVISKHALLRCGLPRKDFFIWWDDNDHSLRLSNYGRIVCFTDIIVHHAIEDNPATRSLLSWKNYYGYRNKIIMIASNYPRRYFYWQCLALWAKSVLDSLKGYSDASIMKKRALHDACCRNMGMHKLYCPGWKPQNPNR